VYLWQAGISVCVGGRGPAQVYEAGIRCRRGGRDQV
jgi:hypothetical protein